jgi:ribosomal protein S18 acetylase RimI-like enzyme
MEPSQPNLICLHDRDDIAARLLGDPGLHLYELGDLDDFFWPYTTWYASPDGGPPLLVYSGVELPVLIGLDRAPFDRLKALLRRAGAVLPAHFYAHLSGDADEVFRPTHRVTSHGQHYKMTLADPGRLANVPTQGVERLSPADLPALQALYAAAYPGNWFDPRMLATGCYFGLRRGTDLVSVAGVHVYSPRYRAAALGNITTHPDFRGQGLCTQVTAALCLALLDHLDHIGLNVLIDNTPAIHCYTRLGFEVTGEYEEFMID